MSFLQDLLGDAYTEGMSAEDISKALEAKKVGVVPADYDKLKNDYQKAKESISKANGEASKYKKQYEAYLDEEAKKKLQQEEELQKLQEENEQLKKSAAVADYTGRLLAIGFDAELAKTAASAIADGDTESFFKSAESFKDSFEKKIRADIMRGASDPVGGTGKSTMTLDDLRKMSVEDRYKFSEEHPDEYKSLYGMKEE